MASPGSLHTVTRTLMSGGGDMLLQPAPSVLSELADELGMKAGALTTVELPPAERTSLLQPWED